MHKGPKAATSRTGNARHIHGSQVYPTNPVCNRVVRQSARCSLARIKLALSLARPPHALHTRKTLPIRSPDVRQARPRAPNCTSMRAQKYGRLRSCGTKTSCLSRNMSDCANQSIFYRFQLTRIGRLTKEWCNRRLLSAI